MTVTAESARNSLAPWHIRAYAWGIDVLAGVAVLTTLVLVSLAVPPYGPWWWLCLFFLGIGVLLLLVNRWLLPAVARGSLGRALGGMVVVRRDGAPVGAWRLFLRDFAHLLDLATLVGWLWPLWDWRRRTFADLLLRTEVRRSSPETQPRTLRRWTAVAVCAATAVCVGSVAVDYAVVYSRQRAVDQTRAQVEKEGPKLVAQMLTYTPTTLADDFARAQASATDKYRVQLAAQQESVRKGQPVINEYWVTNSSLQSATPNAATMLLFMQGRRGEGAQERYLTATVRVAFAKSADHQWRVDNLTVLTKPKTSGNEK